MRYPKSIYKEDSSIVVWSPEEHAAKAADGWSDDKQPAVTRVVEPEERAKPLPLITVKRPARFATAKKS